MEEYRFSDKEATLFSFTEDFATATLNPPLTYAMLDFEGGGRFLFDLTDCETGMLKIGMTFKMGLRRKYIDEARGVIGYFWKGIPVRE